jgi:hypothetical protein
LSVSFAGCGMVTRLFTEEKKVSVKIEDSSDVVEDNSAVVAPPDASENSFDVTESPEIVEPESSEIDEESFVELGFDLMNYAESFVTVGPLDVFVVDDSAFVDYTNESNKYGDSFYNYTVAFRARRDIKNFALLKYDESITLCIEKYFKSVKNMKAGDIVIAQLYVNDMSINSGFAYRETADSDAAYFYFTPDVSGMSAIPLDINIYEPNLDDTYMSIVGKAQNLDYYAFFDIDLDGDNELILRTGLDEAGSRFEFYDMIEGVGVKLGVASAYNSGLFSDGTYLIINGAHMGYEWADKVIIKNGKIELEVIFDREIGYDEDYYEFEYYVNTYRY